MQEYHRACLRLLTIVVLAVSCSATTLGSALAAADETMPLATLF